MKRIFAILLSVWLLLAMLPAIAVTAIGEGETVVNVKDFGAKGDGVTNDYAAMMSAFNYAITHYASKSIPVTVYFPEGKYGLLRGGMYVKMPYGAGNLTVKGAGADKSTIVYLDDWQNSGSWVALRLQLEQDPSTVEDYLHDIVIEDMGVYDTDPVNHAWHPDKGDPGKEETHGFNIQHCVRATIRNCKVDNVGDEAIDMSHCIDSEMVDNLVINSPGAGSAGGGISVGDGSKNVLIARNTSIGSIDASNKVNWAIAVEALEEHIEDIIIENNVIQGINGYGINIGAPAGTIANVLVQNNIITDCSYGGIRLMGSGQTDGVLIANNTIANTAIGVYLEGANKDGTVIDGCIIDTVSDSGVKVSTPNSNDSVIKNTTIRNAQYRAVYNAGTNTKIDGVLIDGAGLDGEVTVGAISQYTAGGSCEVSNTVILNCQSSKGIQSVQRVRNTFVQQDEVSGYTSISGADFIKDCKVNRMISTKNGCTIDGLVLTTTEKLGTHAITLANRTYCTVTNCTVIIPSQYAIYEIRETDYNTITNNVTIGGKGVNIIGANTIATGNVTGTAGATETFAYRVVDGQVTITELLDTSLEHVVIPAMIEGLPVVGVETWAFGLCNQLTSVQYEGTRAAWDEMIIGACNTPLLNAKVRCASDLYAEKVGHSVMDTSNGNGLAFRFELNASGVTVVKGTQANLANATVNYMGVECKLIGMGAVVTNDATIGMGGLTLDAVNELTVTNIPTVYLQSAEEDSCAFATRIINIPSSALSRTVYARPYCIIELDGEQVIIYGAVDSAACVDYM